MGYLCADRYTKYQGLTVPAFTPSQTSGYAPLYVFFDATAVTDASTSYPFHSLLYIWDFGDSGAGTYTTGRESGLSKNVAYGPVAAHLYASVGTYTVTLTVFDGYASKFYTYTNCVTVSSQDSAYPTTATVVVSTSGTFTDKPTGATEVTSSDFDAVIAAHKGTNKRILFRTGETFTASAASTLAGVTGMTLGKFGGATRPTIDTAAALAYRLLTLGGSTNTRITDLALSGGQTIDGQDSILIYDATGSDRVLVYNCTMAGSEVPIALTALTSADQFDELAIFENSFTGMGTAISYNVFGAGSRLGVLGNTFANPGGTHHLRLTWVQGGAVSCNTFTGGVSDRDQIKLHAHTYAADTDYTEEVVISDNSFAPEGTQCVAIGPQNNTADERVRNVICERNLTVSATTSSQTAVNIWAQLCTVRNNVSDTSTSSNTSKPIIVEQRGVEPAPSSVWVYANSFYTTKAVPSGQYEPIYVGAGCVSIIAENNIAYAPNATSPVMITDNSGGGLTQSNNSTASQVKNTDPYASKTTFTPQDYALTAGDTAVPVFDDYDSVRRSYGNKTPVIDMGAVQTS